MASDTMRHGKIRAKKKKTIPNSKKNDCKITNFLFFFIPKSRASCQIYRLSCCKISKESYRKSLRYGFGHNVPWENSSQKTKSKNEGKDRKIANFYFFQFQKD